MFQRKKKKNKKKGKVRSKRDYINRSCWEARENQKHTKNVDRAGIVRRIFSFVERRGEGVRMIARREKEEQTREWQPRMKQVPVFLKVLRWWCASRTLTTVDRARTPGPLGKYSLRHTILSRSGDLNHREERPANRFKVHARNHLFHRSPDRHPTLSNSWLAHSGVNSWSETRVSFGRRTVFDSGSWSEVTLFISARLNAQEWCRCTLSRGDRK